ncbi:EAL domain-containing protein [Ornithinibacillus halotolerans]|uniref:GGDEF domain-containing protein n=1 Tax=Ornithinibacillus halotolerans TaxID=1274357 RepID=A0A916S373_9BACI|nr:EAL domain-containing protein [Ornithinibacillus halotolerans]GGA81760.1 hypothetical protein GCM10008025_26290 [Ornithinibacillus halotolerans]
MRLNSLFNFKKKESTYKRDKETISFCNEIDLEPINQRMKQSGGYSFERKIGELIKVNKPFSLFILELGRLRVINESLGVVTGDSFIEHFRNRVNSLLPRNCFFNRIFADKFALVIWDYDDENLPEGLAKRIVESLTIPFVLGTNDLFATTSIGICKWTDDQTKDQVIRHAWQAFYTARKDGANNIHCYRAIDNSTPSNPIELEKELRRAITNHEFVIHYQPRVSAITNQIIAAEALIRWEHPERGMISPLDFIPLAEEIGLINAIGDWVLAEVCLFIHRLELAKIPIVPISINISAQRLLKKDFKRQVQVELEKNNVNSKFIEFEITEATLLRHEDSVKVAMQELKDLGVKVALDDFGTGYSSLAYVNQFPIDTLKIDRSFVRKATETKESAVIIKSLIYMAKGLELNLVAEGVETFEQLSFLKQQECEEIQGFIFSKPVSEDSFCTLLKKKILKPVSVKSAELAKDRRKYFRVHLQFPMLSKMSIIKVGGRSLEIGNSEVLVEDIGAGGIRMLSTLNLPVRPDLVCNFKFIILGKPHNYDGKISWKEEEHGIYKYGIQFILDEIDRDRLIGVLNHFSSQLRRNPFVPECNILAVDRFQYLKEVATSK